MGYLKKEALVSLIEQLGFEYLGSSDINGNAKDIPSEQDMVWRLAPVNLTAGTDTPERQAELEAIGESNRMTLKFRKPSS